MAIRKEGLNEAEAGLIRSVSAVLSQLSEQAFLIGWYSRGNCNLTLLHLNIDDVLEAMDPNWL